ncbi:hypothetical protein BGZ96_012738 [Linnemannia gamsii]|uniref:Uncharacterized protein n=1 Tax=Linnemannia gamsii TaxID=64522 RepID=A0ABQ7JQ59_9FUNG|nr:hypothetical protein BGZ96_012738 [Linnemannia gamsii]
MAAIAVTTSTTTNDARLLPEVVLYSWPTILNQKHYDTDHSVSSSNESWLRKVYIKHGHLVRHLTIQWIPTLDAAGISNTCNRLESLIAHNVHVTLSPADETHQKQALGWRRIDQVQVRVERTEPLPDEFLLAPNLKEALRPNKVWWTTDKKHGQDWMTGQRFWMLVLQNPGICTLSLGSCLDNLCGIRTTEFLNSTLAELHSLTSLENNIHSEHLEHILDRNPTLTSF